jgi:hypothetical protein
MNLTVLLAALTMPLVVSGPRTSLECSIVAREHSRVEISVRSISGRSVNGEVHSAFKLERSLAGSTGQYWAPVDLDTGRPYGPNQPRSLNLPQGQPLKVTLAPGALLWDRTISSVWPKRPLTELVPDGPYVLYLEIEGPGAGDNAQSNRLTVTVARGVIEFRANQQ